MLMLTFVDLREVDDLPWQAELNALLVQALPDQVSELADAALKGRVRLLARRVHEVLGVELFKDSLHDHHLVHAGSGDGVQDVIAQSAQGPEVEATDQVIAEHHCRDE